MKKTNKPKMGPLGTPLGNPLGYFNSLKAKRSSEPKQKLRRAQDGEQVSGPLTEFTTNRIKSLTPSVDTPIPYDPKYNTRKTLDGTYNSPEGEIRDRAIYESIIREPKASSNYQFNRTMKNGGSVKKTVSIKRKK
jgi:hypothetical protein